MTNEMTRCDPNVFAMNAARLAGLLSVFGIAPRQIRIGGQRCRGYELADFVPVFERVLSDGGA